MRACWPIWLSSTVWARHGAAWQALAARYDSDIVPLCFDPVTGASLVSREEASTARIAFFSRDLYVGSTMTAPGMRSQRFFEILSEAPALQWVQVCSSGVDLPDYAGLHERARHGTAPAKITMTTGAGTTARPIALNVLAAILALERGFPHWHAAQHERAWRPFARDALPRDINGLRIVIVGTGAIGGEIAKRLRDVGCHVTGVRASGRPHPDFDDMIGPSALAARLPQCDWLVLACPLTAETRGMIGERELSQLAAGAGLVNVGRGGLVVEADVVAALRDGRLAKAYLDVFAIEPLPTTSPLWAMPNVWLTPHNASACAGHDERVVAVFTDNLTRWLARDELRNAVAL